MNFDIGEVFTRAWKITWKYKVLWIFGLLASCGRRTSGNFNSRQQISGNQFSSTGPFSNEMMRQIRMVAERVGNWFSQHPWVIVGLIVLFVFVWVVQIFLTTTGSIGLIRGASQTETGIEKIQFASLFSESLHYFWRVIGLGLIVFLPIILFLIALGVLFLAISVRSSSGPEAGLSGVVLFLFSLCCCLLPVMIMLGLYYTQAIRALILEDLGVFKSLSRGWEVFKRNIGGLLLTAVIIFLINLVIGILIAIPIYIAIVPLMLQFLRGNIVSWRPFIVVGTILLCYSPIAWFLNGILTTYSETIWTLIYIRVTKPAENTPIVLPADA